jgi:hypothetical protein
MRLVAPIILIAFFCSSFQLEYPVSKKIQFTAAIEKRECDIIYLSIRLVNNTSDTLKYTSYSCSWQYSYIVANDNWKTEPNTCFRNVRTIVSIPPYQSETKILTLHKITGIRKSHTSDLRIGFNYIPPAIYLEKFSQKEIDSYLSNLVLWSNKISVNYLSKTRQ